MNCLLCGSSEVSKLPSVDQFHNCNHCGTVFRNPSFFVSPEAEKARYLTHNNDVDDPGYQNFVSPIVEAVSKDFSPQLKGLDFGAGTGPVITKLLNEQGYTISLFDPFFHPNTSVLEEQYDFIICCEVIEHFYNPLKEFRLLKSILQEKGKLYCMTDLVPEAHKFKAWYYKDDKTHVIFYSEENLKWIQEKVGFKSVSIEGRLVIFEY